MKTALELYNGVLRELSLFNSPAFDAADFNRYINRAVLQYVEQMAAAYESSDRATDALSPIARQAVYELADNETTAQRFVALPTTITVDDAWQRGPFFKMGLCQATIKCRKDTFRYKRNDEIELTCRKLTSDMKGFILNNSMLCPSLKRFFYQRFENNLHIEYDTSRYPNRDFYLRRVRLEYLIEPPKIELGFDEEQENPEDQYESIADSVFAPKDNEQIVTLCTNLFREDMNRRRAQ